MLRAFALIIWTILETVVLGLFIIFLSFFGCFPHFSHKVAVLWAKGILFVSNVDVTMKGLSHLHPGTSYILMPNHQSNFDIPVILGTIPVQFRWLAKKELFFIPIFGRGMKACEYISIDRSNLASAIESLREVARIVCDGVSVLIFPEGTRSLDGRIGKFKKGGFVLAVETGIPILPIVIDGTLPIMPKGSILVRPGFVRIEILPPVETTGYTLDKKEELMDAVRLILVENLQRVREANRSC
jgi:1-acyl-sn-glycerol-3-phosphate acyltransferase